MTDPTPLATDGIPATLAEWIAGTDSERHEWRERARARAADVTRSHGVFIGAPLDTAPDGDVLRAGELSGIPFAVKDNIDVRGAATTAGSPLFEGSIAPTDAGAVGALRETGAVPIGKTNLHELAFGITSDNAHFGAVRNPLDPTRVPGGSSGGSAAVVGLGVVPFSLGTDTGASVTVPASFCGIVGFRPSTGRYPGDGVINLSWTRDTIGIHAHTVADVRRVDRIITRARPDGAGIELRGQRIGVPVNRFEDLAPEVAEVAEATLTLLSRRGVTLVDVRIEDEDALADESGMAVVRYETAQMLGPRLVRAGLAAQVPPFAEIATQVASPDVREIADGIASSPVSAAQYAAAREKLWMLRRRYAETFAGAGIGALIAPTSVALPPKIGSSSTMRHNGRDVPLFATLTRNVTAGTTVGVPMISLPAGRTAEGLSVGMTLEGGVFEDLRLLELAAAVEAAL